MARYGYDDALERRAVAGVTNHPNSYFANNDALRSFNDAETAAAKAQWASPTSIDSRFNPLAEGSAFRRENPTAWNYLNAQYGQPDTVPGSENFDAQKYHDQAMQPSVPGTASAMDHLKDYSQPFQQTILGQDKYLNPQKYAGMARLSSVTSAPSAASQGDPTAPPPVSSANPAPAQPGVGSGILDTLGKGLKSYYSNFLPPVMQLWNATKKSGIF